MFVVLTAHGNLINGAIAGAIISAIVALVIGFLNHWDSKRILANQVKTAEEQSRERLFYDKDLERVDEISKLVAEFCGLATDIYAVKSVIDDMQKKVSNSNLDSTTKQAVYETISKNSAEYRVLIEKLQKTGTLIELYLPKEGKNGESFVVASVNLIVKSYIVEESFNNDLIGQLIKNMRSYVSDKKKEINRVIKENYSNTLKN